MMVNLIFSAVLCAAVVVPTSHALISLQGVRVKRQNVNELERPNFRYLIIGNSIQGAHDPNDGQRIVEVLLDGKAFSEETLKKLFKLISKRYPKPKWMTVWVYTSLEQLPTPEEEDGGRVSESDSNPGLYRHHRAVLYREDGDELFRYSHNPPSTDMKTVVLKSRGTLRK